MKKKIDEITLINQRFDVLESIQQDMAESLKQIQQNLSSNSNLVQHVYRAAPSAATARGPSIISAAPQSTNTATKTAISDIIDDDMIDRPSARDIDSTHIRDLIKSQCSGIIEAAITDKLNFLNQLATLVKEDVLRNIGQENNYQDCWKIVRNDIIVRFEILANERLNIKLHRCKDNWAAKYLLVRDGIHPLAIRAAFDEQVKINKLREEENIIR